MVAPARRGLAAHLRPVVRRPRPVGPDGRPAALRRGRALPSHHRADGALRRRRRGPAGTRPPPAGGHDVRRGAQPARSRPGVGRRRPRARGDHPRRPRGRRARRPGPPHQPGDVADAEPPGTELRQVRRRPHADDRGGGVPADGGADGPAPRRPRVGDGMLRLDADGSSPTPARTPCPRSTGPGSSASWSGPISPRSPVPSPPPTCRSTSRCRWSSPAGRPGAPTSRRRRRPCRCGRSR